MKGRGQARPEPPGRDDKRQPWRHFTDTISTCPSAAASGSTQPGGGRQCAARSQRDKEETHGVLANPGRAVLRR